MVVIGNRVTLSYMICHPPSLLLFIRSRWFEGGHRDQEGRRKGVSEKGRLARREVLRGKKEKKENQANSHSLETGTWEHAWTFSSSFFFSVSFFFILSYLTYIVLYHHPNINESS